MWRAWRALPLLVIALSQPAHAGDWETPAATALHTNESRIAEALRPADGFAIEDPDAVLSFVLGSLPPRVRVYPTENYYYFSFLHGGVSYAGNIRLDAGDRDAGKLHFSYFRQQTPWLGRTGLSHRVLGGDDGVRVERLGALTYRVGTGAATVVFELNDLSGVRPPQGLLLAQEDYLGPVFDESGIRFFLLFNRRARVFHYVLDETAPVGDRLAPTGVSDRIRVGMRTGFAYYDDHRAPRKILIGVYAENERLNTPFDGPFDQLPDNFVEGDALRRAIVAADPGVEGRIDRLGRYAEEERRYLIAPYVRYDALTELAGVESCASRTAAETAGRSGAYAACFAGTPIGVGQ